MSDNLEVLNQFLNQLLIPRIRISWKLKDQGRPYLAVKSLKELIFALNFIVDDKDDVLKTWEKKIKELDNIQSSSNSHTRAKRQYERDQLRNQAAEELYEELMWEIGDLFEALKIFELSNGLSNFFDPSDGKKSGNTAYRKKR